MRLLPRFVYRAPLLPVGGALSGAMAELALAVARPAPAALSRYARRAAFRATPQGLWAGVGMGTLAERTRARTGPMRAALTVPYERLWRFARAQLDGEAGREQARLRVAPSLMRDDGTALWLSFGDDAAAEPRAAEVDELLARILDGAADWIAWPALRELAAVDDELLLLLVDDGLLLHDGAPPLVGRPPLQWMAARHAGWAELAARLAAPTVEVVTAVDEPLQAVLVHEGAVQLSRAAVERAAALAPLLFRLQQALAPPLHERALDAGSAAALRAAEEIFGAGAYDLDALALGGYGTPLDAEPADGAAAPPPADAQVVRVIVDAVVEALASGAGQVALDVARLDAVAPRLATPPSFELMLTPMRERRRARPGDGWLVGLHAPAGASWGRFAHALGAPLMEAMAPLMEALPDAVDVDYAPSPRLADLTAHPPLRAATLALSSWPEGEVVTPSSLSLALDSARGEPSLQRADAPLTPSPLWRVRSTTAPPGAFRLLTGWSLTRQHAPWALQLGALGDLAHVPRLLLDGFVVAPASWRIPEVADRATLRRWRRALAVPRQVQIGHEDELLLVDLDARDAVETLRRLPAEARPRAFEVWPPLDAGIDAGGRRLEAVIAVVADEAGSPAPLERVAPPAEQGAAPDWHTWKLFGAADRADRVLGLVVAPAIADALAAAEIDAWFFLRYVDGPGRRDHLRLRVRAADAAPFAARLSAALAPARAAGDVVTVERTEYQRERARYGADAVDAVERVFEADSALALALLDAEATDVVELLVASYDALAAGAGLDPGERQTLARRRREAYGIGRDPALADEYRARQQALRARLASPSPPLLAHQQRVASALASLAPSRRAALLPALLHLAAVRLVGADAAREAAAFYLWERTRESLARHRER